MAAFSWRIAPMRHARSSSWVAGLAARSGASAGADARAACRPASSSPRSSAIPVSASRSPATGDAIAAARRSAVSSYASLPSATYAWSIATVEAPSSRVTASAQPASRGTPANAASSER